VQEPTNQEPVEVDLKKVEWPYGVVVDRDLVYKFYIINNRSNNVSCVLNFIDDNEHTNPINLRYPKAGIKAKVEANSIKTVFIAPKIIPSSIEQQEESVPMLTNNFRIAIVWKEKTKIQAVSSAQPNF